MEYFNKAIELHPVESTYFDSRGTCLIELGEYKKAIEDLTKAIALNKEFEPSWNRRGVCYFHLEKYQEAVQDFTQAIKLKPLKCFYENRAEAY